MNVKKKNIDTPIASELTKLMEALDKHVPNIRFVCNESRQVFNAGLYTDRYIQANCFIEYEAQGTIGYGKYGKRKPKEDTSSSLYSVDSNKIDNLKRPYNCKQSFKMRPVLKECVRLFKPTPPADVAERVSLRVESIFRGLFERHKHRIRWDVVKEKADAVKFREYKTSAISYLVGKSVSFKDIRSCFSEDSISELQKAYKSFLIVKDLHDEMEEEKGFFISEETDDTYNVVHTTNHKKLVCATKDFDELPEVVQTKLMALKVASFQEAVQNIGVNLSQNVSMAKNRYYYISEKGLENLV